MRKTIRLALSAGLIGYGGWVIASRLQWTTKEIVVAIAIYSLVSLSALVFFKGAGDLDERNERGRKS